MVPIVSIVGKSNSGKTTLIEKIIPALKARGYNVGAIKHDAHHFDIDYEGKDTWRMSKSGADTVVISSKSKVAMVKAVNEERTLDEIAELLFKDADIIITEGYKAQNKPKIEVVRFNEIITLPSENLIAVVNNKPCDMPLLLPDLYRDICLFNVKDIEMIAEFIESSFLKSNRIRQELLAK